MYYAIAVPCFCIAVAVIDLKTYRIPDVLLVLFTLVTVIIERNQPFALLIPRFAAAALSFLLFGAVWHYSQGIGLGDVKYAAVLGYLLGPERLAIAFLVTALLGFFIYAAGFILYHWPKTTKIPFAPFLSAGAIMALSVNQNITGVIL